MLLRIQYYFSLQLLLVLFSKMDLITLDLVEALRNKLRTDMNNFTDDLANGQCTTFEQYKELCGVIRGLAYAERHLIDLAENLEKDTDE